jgi:hypothetical protein
MKIEIELINELSEARKVHENPITYIESPIPLKDKEKCLYWTSTVEIKRKKEKEKFVYTQISKGNIHITNLRVLFVSQGSLSIRYKDIISKNIVSENRFISITKDGRQTPYFFKVDKPYVLLEYLNLAIEQLNRQ